MKIAIVTYYSAHNYGAMLQAFALQYELAQMGHAPVHLNLRKIFGTTSKYNRRRIRSISDLRAKIVYILSRGFLERRFARFEEFLASELIETRHYKSEDELIQAPPDVDAYVYGSDQIWNLQSGIDQRFFGAYAPKDTPILSYAPSFGAHVIPDQIREEVKGLLMRFDYLSVREEEGRQMVEDLTGKPVTKVIDPIFLVDDATWKSLETPPKVKRPYIAFYSLESSKRVSGIVRKISKELSMPVVVLGKPGTFMATCSSILAIDSGPREFLGWIRNASLVLTNSFHATAFAVKFGVPLITIAHSHRNSRMEDLLSGIGAEDRIIAEKGALAGKERDWLLAEPPPETTTRISAQVATSRKYLEESLKAAERHHSESLIH